MKCIEVHSFGSRHLVVIFFHHFHPVGQHAQQCCQQCCQHCCDLRLKTVFRRFNSASGGSLDVQVGCRMGGKWRPTKEWRHIGERWLAAWLACNRIGQTHGFAFSIFSDCMLKFEVIWSHLKSSEVIWSHLRSMKWQGFAGVLTWLGHSVDFQDISKSSSHQLPLFCGSCQICGGLYAAYFGGRSRNLWPCGRRTWSVCHVGDGPINPSQLTDESR